MRMNCANDSRRCKAMFFKIGLMAVGGIAVLTWVVMALWNWLMPALFSGAASIGYIQALGILLLSKILFGGFHGGGHGHWRGRHQRWESMSPEEREQLKVHLKGRWGHWCGSAKQDDKAPSEAPARPQ